MIVWLRLRRVRMEQGARGEGDLDLIGIEGFRIIPFLKAKKSALLTQLRTRKSTELSFRLLT